VVRIERHVDVHAFFERVAPFLAAREAEHNLLLGFRTRLELDPHAFGPDDPTLASAEDGDEVIGVAVRTPPHNLVLSLMEPHVAAAFADALAGEPLPGLNAPLAAGEAFVARWPASATVAVEERAYEATEVIAPRPTPGAMRRATEADRPLLVEWMAAFFEEAMGDLRSEDPAQHVDHRLADEHGALVLWEDGRAVSFAGYGSPTPNGMRIGPVYTPPELRGRGYASALTAAATREVLASGRRFCFLYTNLANPTSNSIYRRIGYRPVLDVNLWRFG
jgi:uncharacterized protein